MSILEAALRGGAVAVLLLIVFLLARDLRTSRLSRYSALLFLGAAAFAIDSAPRLLDARCSPENSGPYPLQRHAGGVLDHGGGAVRR